jgi:hypothetical protein
MGGKKGKPIGGRKTLTTVVKKQATTQGVVLAAARGLLLVRLRYGSLGESWGMGYGSNS